MTDFITQIEPWIDNRELDELKRVVDSTYVVEHNLTKEFEEMICEMTGSKYAVAMTNGTAALFCCLKALGIGEELIESSFKWTPSRIGGIGIEEICDDYLLFHKNAFSDSKIPSNLKLDLGGLYLWRGTGERHMWSPETISLLQKSSTQNDSETYQ